jgi:hypothetical protein
MPPFDDEWCGNIFSKLKKNGLDSLTTGILASIQFHSQIIHEQNAK